MTFYTSLSGLQASQTDITMKIVDLLSDGGLLFLPLPRRRRPMRGMKKWPLYCAGMV